MKSLKPWKPRRLLPLPRMNTPTAVALLGCLAAVVANALPQGNGDNQVFGPAPADPRDCRCQCSSLGFTDSYGVRQGNCMT